jgi:putative MATE family efflux protein
LIEEYNTYLSLRRFMKTTIPYSRIWSVAYPIILGSVAQNLVNFTDTAFLGRVGEIALGAGALGGIFYLAVIMLGLGFSTGSQIIIARRLGEGKLKEIGPVVNHSVIFLFILALISFLLLRFGSVVILKNFIRSPSVYEGTITFLQYRSFGIFFAFMNFAHQSFFVGITKTKVVTYTTLVLAGANIIFDYILIFGKFGFPEMGIAGAALASSIAEACALLYYVIYTRVTIKFSDYNLFRFNVLSLKRMMNILNISFPMMLQSFFSLSVWFIFFLFVEKLGETALAVSNIIRSIFVVLMVPIWGFATATNTLVSYLIGIKRQDEVMSLVYKIIALCLAGVLGVVSIILIFRESVFRIYTHDDNLIALGIPVLYVISGAAILFSASFILFNSVSGTGKTRSSLFIEIIVLAIYIVYTYSLITFWHANVTAAWTAELLYSTILGLFSFLYIKSNRWKTNYID